ncbi:MAG TPA: MmcQ/YjbR family DNA-binding protein [Vicinamibacterales bacterium]|nr:MmcQ/YjbR family DNA-binding protein [Vicinamibacterales bacterium]
MTPAQFRKIALGLDGAVEGSHMGHPDFRAANGRIFASLNDDETRGMATLTPEQQADLMSRAPATFIPAAGAWGRGGSTMIVLKGADAELVGEAVTLAWQRIASQPKSKSKPRAAKSVSKSRSRR